MGSPLYVFWEYKSLDGRECQELIENGGRIIENGELKIENFGGRFELGME
jgi:hypothetical protein